MAVDYLKDYLGVDPNDYSAMEQGIAGISPLGPGQSIIPQTPSMPKASIMSEGDFANATAPLMGRVYQREAEGRERAEGLSNELQALRQEMAQTSEAEVEKRAALERQMQETMQRENDAKRELERQMQNFSQERDTSQTSAEDLANELQGVQANLQEITQLRDTAVQNYQDALAQQDVIRQQASENEAIQLEEQRNSLLAEREGIVTTLEQDFGVQRSELESLVGSLEGKVGELESVRGSLQGEIDNLSSQMQGLELEKQDALAQQDIIRAESAQAQQDALAQQAEQFTGEKSGLEQQIADLQAQITQQGSTPDPDPTLPDPDPNIGVPPGGMELFDPRGKYDMDYRDKVFDEDETEYIDIDKYDNFEVDIDKINALTPDDINPYIPFNKLDMDIDLSNLDLGEYGDAIQYPGGSAGFDETGGIDLFDPRKMPAAPITGGSDFAPKPPRDIRPPMPPSIGRIEDRGGNRIRPPMPPSIGRIDEGNRRIPRMPNENPVPFIPKRNKKPMQPKSVGRRGPVGRGMRPMSRASGGSISQAIADLQNKLK